VARFIVCNKDFSSSLQWQYQEKGAALTRSALGPNAPPVRQGDGAANGQAQAGAPFLARVCGIHLLKALKDSLQLLWWNAPPLVFDRDQ
jgi:hypothetical protein